MHGEGPKDYVVTFTGRTVYLYVTVEADNEKEAIDTARDEMTLEFTSEDGNTECTIEHTSFSGIEEMNFEKEE